MLVGIDQTLLGQFTSSVKLVQGDTRPPLIVSLTNQTINTTDGSVESTNVDLGGCSVLLKLKAAGATASYDDVVGTLLPGKEADDGTISFASPYNIAGAGGRIAFNWNADSLSIVGDITGEIEITYADQKVQTVYNVVRLKVRAQF